MNKEKKFLELIKDYSIKISSDTFPNIIYYYNSKNKKMFSYYGKYDILWIEHGVLDTFRKKYNIKNNKLIPFFRKKLSKFLGLEMENIGENFIKEI